MQDKEEQKAKIDREQANELEDVDETQKSDDSGSSNTGERIGFTVSGKPFSLQKTFSPQDQKWNGGLIVGDAPC